MDGVPGHGKLPQDQQNCYERDGAKTDHQAFLPFPSGVRGLVDCTRILAPLYGLDLDQKVEAGAHPPTAGSALEDESRGKGKLVVISVEV